MNEPALQDDLKSPLTLWIENLKRFRVLFLAGIVFCSLSAYGIQRLHQNQEQLESLNYMFTKVQPKNGGVLFVSSNKGLPMGIRDHPDILFAKPFLLYEDSRFGIADQHFFIEYTIQEIEKDGVIIGYTTQGTRPSLIRRSHGIVKLAWK